MDTCVCVTESLCFLPETTLLIGYTPVQNKKNKNGMSKKKSKPACLQMQKHHFFVYCPQTHV